MMILVPLVPVPYASANVDICSSKKKKKRTRPLGLFSSGFSPLHPLRSYPASGQLRLFIISQKKMLDVASKEELLADSVEVTSPTTSSSNGSGSSGSRKPYLKFGVSAILGLDDSKADDHHQVTEKEVPELELLPELSYYHQHHHNNNNSKGPQFHPAYIQSYFHPLIHHHHIPSPSKSFNGNQHFLFFDTANPYTDKSKRFQLIPIRILITHLEIN